MKGPEGMFGAPDDDDEAAPDSSSGTGTSF
jgi:hypothetical protein